MDINAIVHNDYVQALTILSANVALFEFIARLVKNSINEPDSQSKENIICDECKKEISLNALYCPNCGNTEIFDSSVQLNNIYKNLLNIFGSFTKSSSLKTYFYKIVVLIVILLVVSIIVIFINNANYYKINSYTVYYSYSAIFAIFILLYDVYIFNFSHYSISIINKLREIKSNTSMLKERCYYHSENIDREYTDVKYISNFLFVEYVDNKRTDDLIFLSYFKVLLVFFTYLITSNYVLDVDLMKALSGPPFMIVVLFIFPVYIFSQKSNNSNYSSTVDSVSDEIYQSLNSINSWCGRP